MPRLNSDNYNTPNNSVANPLNDIFPNEIFDEVLSYLTPYEQALTRVINKSFKDYVGHEWLIKYGRSFKDSMKIFEEIEKAVMLKHGSPKKQIQIVFNYIRKKGYDVLPIILLKSYFYRRLVTQLKKFDEFPKSQAIFTSTLQNIWIKKLGHYGIANLQSVSSEVVINNLNILKKIIQDTASHGNAILLDRVVQNDHLFLTALLYHPTYQLIFESFCKGVHGNIKDKQLAILAFSTIELLNMEDACSLKALNVSFDVNQLKYILQQELSAYNFLHVKYLKELDAPLDFQQLKDIARQQLSKLHLDDVIVLQDLGTEIDLQQVNDLLEAAIERNTHYIEDLTRCKENAIRVSNI